MNDFDDSYRAMPVGVIAASFAVTMLVDFMPFPFDVFFWLHELTALMLHPQRVGMGIAFLLGLIVDAATAATLGLHALSYTVMVYFVLNTRRQIMLYGHIMQIGAVLAALFCHQAVLVAARLFLNNQIITWQSFIAPLAGALLWPFLSQLMLVLTNFYRANR